MDRSKSQSPYCVFKDDRERRRALNVRDVSWALALVAVSLMDSPGRLADFLHTLKLLFTRWP